MTDAKRAYNRQYYQANREKLIEAQRARYSANATHYTAAYRGYRKQWRLANKEHVRRVNQEWYRRLKADPIAWAAHNIVQKTWLEANKAAVLAYQNEWSKANVHKRRLKHRLYRTKRRGAAGHTSYVQWLARYTYYAGCCAYCGVPVPLDKCTKDHVKPVVAGGSNWPANLVPACSTCNSRKQNKRWIPRPVWQTKET